MLYDNIIALIESGQIAYYAGKIGRGTVTTAKVAYTGSKKLSNTISDVYTYLTPIERIDRKIDKLNSDIFAAKSANNKFKVNYLNKRLNVLNNRKKEIQKKMIESKQSYIAKTKLLNTQLNDLKQDNVENKYDEKIKKIELTLNKRAHLIRSMEIDLNQ